MTPDALDTTNIWLAIIALVSLIEFLALAAAGFVGFRLYRRATVVLEDLERQHVAPLTARVTAILDDVKNIAERVQGYEHQLSDVVHRVDASADRAVATVKARLWPFVGIARGMRAAVSAATAPDTRTHRGGTTEELAVGK